ncbi:YlaI family protein [Listeria sp. PSOL-1]|uniref:YlaI family protein n=1 Tax=Listeria sp. PSOL-1 TaxID=1844999 RepID=UPI0013D0E889|nr:YlaI family protein [Listeria sp. PSOL-1]
MKAKCVLCDQTHELDDKKFKTKQLRNKPVRLYLCDECNDRISANTIRRVNSGNFHFNKPYTKPFSQLKKELEKDG